MIIYYPAKNSNLSHGYYGLGFVAAWNTRQTEAVITFLGKAVVVDSQVYGSTLLDQQVGTAIVVDKTDE